MTKPEQARNEVTDVEPSQHCPTCGRDWDGRPARPVHLAAALTYDPRGWARVQEILEEHRAGLVRILRQLAEEQSDPQLRALAHEAADRFAREFQAGRIGATEPPD